MDNASVVQVKDQLVSALQGAGELVEPEILLPTAVMLELSGESVRGRLCSFSGGEGEEHCLRPDMTVAIAQSVAQGRFPAAQYIYCGPVFRHPADADETNIEFTQCGFEWFDDAAQSDEQDARGLATVLEAVKSTGLTDVRIEIGDSSLFQFLLEAMDLPEPWAAQLSAAFKHRQGPRDLINNGLVSGARSPLASAIASLSEADAHAAVEEVFAVSGISAVGGRSAGDVAARLLDQSKAQSAPELSDAQKNLLLGFLDIHASLDKAAKVMARLAKDAGLKPDRLVEAFSLRRTAFAEIDPSLAKTAVFGAEFGRRFDYYDGLVFEVRHATLGERRPVASGGRYDGLLSTLSEGRVNAPALGAAIRPDRISEALAKGNAQ